MPRYVCEKYTPYRHPSELAQTSVPFRLLEMRRRFALHPPLIDGSDLFVGGGDGVLRMCDRKTLETTWEYAPPEGEQVAPVLSTDWVVVKARRGLESWLHLLDRHSGNYLGEIRPGKSFRASGAITVSSRLIGIWRDDGQRVLASFDLSSQQVLWERSYEASSLQFQALPCLLTDDAHFLVDDSEQALSCRRVDNGEVRWRYDFSEQDLSLGQPGLRDVDLMTVKAVISVRDRVYIALCNHVIALDAASGDEIWRQVTEISSTADNMLYDPQLDRLCFIFASWYLALDAQTGEVLVNRKHPDQVPEVMLPGFASVTKDHFLAASWRRPELYAFDKQSGELVWKTELDDRVARPNAPVVVGGRVYVVDLSHNLYVFEPAPDG